MFLNNRMSLTESFAYGETMRLRRLSSLLLCLDGRSNSSIWHSSSNVQRVETSGTVAVPMERHDAANDPPRVRGCE